MEKKFENAVADEQKSEERWAVESIPFFVRTSLSFNRFSTQYGGARHVLC
jgi:hypothetical protein